MLREEVVPGITSQRRKDLVGGLLMIALGIFAMVQGSTYTIGSFRRMGPGFFPVALGAILALVGLAIVAAAWFSATDREEARLPPEWRGWLCIVASLVAFVVLGRYGGLLPASFAVVFISALGDRQNGWKSALLLSSAILVVAVVVFWWALQMQFPLLAWG
jgi:Tripartite tricarboxylate transporter TctB family